MSVNRIRITSKAGAVIALSVIGLVLAACSSGGAARKRDADGRIIPTLAEQDPTSTLYAKSVSQAAHGECDSEIMDVLTCFAYRGHGYEGAQMALGQCYIAKGQEAEGAEWVQRAANSGWPDAQKMMATLYLKGQGVDQDPVEGAKWAKLYTRNPSLLSLGVQPDVSIVQEFRGSLTSEQNAVADQRASSWVPSYWTPTSVIDRDVRRSCAVEGRHRVPSMPDIESVPNPY
ncbi:MAG: hypothetical protein CMI61_00840 [Parvibaculum sp.]|nr:hypothetical protein [Parvibaculum sp.]